MSVLAEVFGGLNAMSLWQLLAAFGACIGYGFAQGSMVTPRGRAIALSVMLIGIAGFSLQSADWVRAVMLGAFAIAGFGLFTATVWLTCRVIGIDRVASESTIARAVTEPSPQKPGTHGGLSSPIASV